MPSTYDLIIRGGLVVDGTSGEPFSADVAVKDGLIAAVGLDLPGSAAEEVDATGLIVTPGFVDVHTHYDGQASWSSQFTPSSFNGVTTVVMGNCGVGFAPCRPADRESLVKLMEGVEDIPGVVLDEGLPWNWETFPEYLDAIEAKPHDIDFAAYVPHAALRVWVMGERALRREPSTAADQAEMARLLREALRAGAVGFGSSQSLYHRSADGEVTPTVAADEDEYMALVLALKAEGRGLMQCMIQPEQKLDLWERLMRASGRPFTFTLNQQTDDPDRAYRVLRWVERMSDEEGLSIKAQVLPRPIGLMLSHSLTLTPFANTPTLHGLGTLPLEQRMVELRKPEIREKILAEYHTPVFELSPFGMHSRDFGIMFPMVHPLDYEPKSESSIASEAARRGISPEALAYDLLLEDDGHAQLFMTPSNYPNCSLDFVVHASARKDVVVGLGDGGAHLGMLCDASYTTTMLVEWPKQRPDGVRMSLAQTVFSLTRKTAELVGFLDRGIIAPGLRADINLIDLDRLALHRPQIVCDLPAGGRRLHQGADGYVATYVAGVAIQREGVATGALPGKLVRGPQEPARPRVLQALN